MFGCSLGSGSTWAASGIVGVLSGTTAEIAVRTHSAKLYRELHDDGHDIGE